MGYVDHFVVILHRGFVFEITLSVSSKRKRSQMSKTCVIIGYRNCVLETYVATRV